MSADADIVVAGAGHNSLITAAYLARAGLRVLVLEARPLAGGNTVTEELTLPGFRHDSCSSGHVLIQSSPTLRADELGLAGYGLRYVQPDPVVTMPFEDGSSLTMWRDRQRTAVEIEAFSPKDARAYLRLLDEYESVKGIFGAQRYTPVGFGPTLEEALSAHPQGMLWRKRYRQSAWEIVQEYFEDDHVRSFILWLAFMTVQPIDRPYTGRLAYAIASGRQSFSWTTPVGGSGALPAALVACIQDHGGTVLTGKRVVDLIMDGGRCVGVRCAGGESFRARRAVVSSVHIKHLVEMASPQVWGESFLHAVATWQPGFTLFAAHYALREAPRYPQQAGAPAPAVAVGTAGSSDNLLALMGAIRRGRIHQETPVLLVVCPTVADPSRAPEGMHTLKVLSFFPYELAEGGPSAWDRIKDEVARCNLEYLRRFAPNLSETAILAHHVESPLDLERRNAHNWRGSCHGGELSPAQAGEMRPAPGWAAHRMPIPGLYQTGATTHPGGSVSGGPGRNAAWVVLHDLGYSLDAVIANARTQAHA